MDRGYGYNYWFITIIYDYLAVTSQAQSKRVLTVLVFYP